MEFSYFDSLQQAQKAYTRLLEPVCAQWNTTRNELDILLFLANNPEFDRATDIVTHRGVTKSHVSLSVTALEARGLLKRRIDPADRRTIHLELAGDAPAIAQAGQDAQKQFFDRIFSGLTPEEFSQWRGIMEKVTKNIISLEKR